MPVVGFAYRFIKICIKVYNFASPTKALIFGIKRIFIDCTPPAIKYLLLCAEILACGETACFTGDPNFVVDSFECYTAIVEI